MVNSDGGRKPFRRRSTGDIRQPYSRERYKRGNARPWGRRHDGDRFGGADVIPALVDGHYHFMNRAARALFGVRLDFYSNVRDLVNSVGEKARALGAGKLVMSTAGNAIELLDELRAPTIEELDAVAPLNPVILTMEDGRRVNSRMLERVELTPDTPVPAGGTIGRDDETGRLNGIVAGTAIPLVLDRASDLGGSPRVYTPEQMREAFLWGQREANAIGLTGVRHPHTEIYEMRVLQSLWETGELTLRVAMDIGFEPHHQSPEELGRKLSAWGKIFPKVSSLQHSSSIGGFAARAC